MELFSKLQRCAHGLEFETFDEITGRTESCSLCDSTYRKFCISQEDCGFFKAIFIEELVNCFVDRFLKNPAALAAAVTCKGCKVRYGKVFMVMGLDKAHKGLCDGLVTSGCGFLGLCKGHVLDEQGPNAIHDAHEVHFVGRLPSPFDEIRALHLIHQFLAPGNEGMKMDGRKFRIFCIGLNKISVHIRPTAKTEGTGTQVQADKDTRFLLPGNHAVKLPGIHDESFPWMEFKFLVRQHDSHIPLDGKQDLDFFMPVPVTEAEPFFPNDFVINVKGQSMLLRDHPIVVGMDPLVFLIVADNETI